MPPSALAEGKFGFRRGVRSPCFLAKQRQGAKPDGVNTFRRPLLSSLGPTTRTWVGGGKKAPPVAFSSPFPYGRGGKAGPYTALVFSFKSSPGGGHSSSLPLGQGESFVGPYVTSRTANPKGLAYCMLGGGFCFQQGRDRSDFLWTSVVLREKLLPLSCASVSLLVN